jgi:hypothetical protein
MGNSPLLRVTVIPANAGIHALGLSFRGGDGPEIGPDKSS